MGWGGMWEGGSGWGAHVNPWLIHVNVWQKPLQYYKVISFQVIKVNEKKKYNRTIGIGYTRLHMNVTFHSIILFILIYFEDSSSKI